MASSLLPFLLSEYRAAHQARAAEPSVETFVRWAESYLTGINPVVLIEISQHNGLRMRNGELLSLTSNGSAEVEPYSLEAPLAKPV